MDGCYIKNTINHKQKFNIYTDIRHNMATYEPPRRQNSAGGCYLLAGLQQTKRKQTKLPQQLQG